MVQAEVQALALGPGGLLFQGKENLAKLALAHRMPAVLVTGDTAFRSVAVVRT